MNAGVQNFLNLAERRREEEKQNATKYKHYAGLAEATGMLTKDQAAVMDADTLEGFMNGKMWQAHEQRLNQDAALKQMLSYDKLLKDQAIAGFGQDLTSNLSMGYSPQLSDYYENPENYQQRPPADPLASFADADARNPMAAADERFGTMGTMAEKFDPSLRQYAPTDNYRMLMEIDKLKAGGNADAAAKLEEERQARMHPTGQDRFDLPYSQQMLMQNELNALHASYANPDFRPAFIKEAEKAKLKPDQLYLQKLNAIESKYKDRLRKAVQTATPAAPSAKRDETPVRVKDKTGQVGFVPKWQLEQAEKNGYTVVK